MKVPFLDLKAQYDAIAGEIDDAIRQVIERTAFSGGPFVSAFEEQFAAFCQCKYSIGVGSGTEALWLALAALDVGPGTKSSRSPTHSSLQPNQSVFCGATPVFVDVDEHSQTMNPALLEGAITEKTKAIIPVHLFGQMADMGPIMEVARRHNLFVIEDACQAHGALYNGRPAGSIGTSAVSVFIRGRTLVPMARRVES